MDAASLRSTGIERACGTAVSPVVARVRHGLYDPANEHDGAGILIQVSDELLRVVG